MKKLLVLLSAGILALTALWGCGAEEPRTIRLICDDPGAQQAWQQLADSYLQTHPVKVEILCPAPEEYEGKLKEAMESETPPVILCCDGAFLAGWENALLDLTGTGLEQQCVNRDHCLLGSQGQVNAVGYAKEYTGILVNKALLKAAGHNWEEIRDLQSLTMVAQDLAARGEELRFYAFATAGTEAARQLILAAQRNCGKGIVPDHFRDVLDLYAQCSTAQGADLAFLSREEALEAFANGQAAFCIGTSQDYPRLLEAGMQGEDLAMIPVYCGDQGEGAKGLAMETVGYWAVNSQAAQEDTQAALEFLEWVASSREGLAMVQNRYGEAAFQGAPEPENPFCRAAHQLKWEGRYPTFWTAENSEIPEEQIFALRVYFSAPGDSNWDEAIDQLTQS